MTYEATLAYMFEQLPMYQRVGQVAYKANLDNTIALLNACNNPEKGLVCIHIAGTNGKGSTASMLASIFQEAGYKTGLYTSPHLVDFRERITINGQWIDKNYIVDFVSQYQADFNQIKPSFFEMTVAMAFSYFKKQQTDIAIIETGLGGRLDSTNLVLPEVSVITNISLDHTHLLGNTLALIAAEKGGIIKANIPVVIGDEQQEVIEVLAKIAKLKQAPLHLVNQASSDKLPISDLIAGYQAKNIRTTLSAIALINKQNRFKISESDIANGLNNVQKNTGFAGRWQIIQSHPKVIVDVGHNEDGWRMINAQLATEDYDNLHIVFGAVNDKSLDDIFNLLPKNATYYGCAANIPRALAIKDLSLLFEEHTLQFEIFSSVILAYESALSNSKSGDLILVAGSLFIVGEVLAEKR
jgi:dihydrofolate synthase/folylpolyglutamate synthase